MDFREEKIILGCMRMGDKSIHEAKTIIQTAIDAGIRFFDHADIYGKNGTSEIVFAKALSELDIERKDIILQSKIGIDQKNGLYDSSYEYIIKKTHDILARLQTDYLDVLLIHRPDALMEAHEVAQAFKELKALGKVKHFGVSNFNNFQIEYLESELEEPLVINQVQFGLMHTIMIDEGINVNLDKGNLRANGILEYSMLNNIQLQAWSPFQHGFIEGPFIDNDDFPEINEALDVIAHKYNVSKTTIATAWILRHPANIQVVSGSMTPSRIKDVALAQDITLTKKEWYDLYKAAGNVLP
ncbi:MAG TPA: aldo/keto reductase [Erysipelothrix sp.]|nr:aldo/keto reductase [Erysipelothrix sp.]